jgi:hypothetical protein
MNWQENYKATLRGTHQYAKSLNRGDGKQPEVARTIGYQCSFIVGVEAIASEGADNHLDGCYIPPALWRMLLREWRRDTAMLRGLDDRLGGETKTP